MLANIDIFAAPFVFHFNNKPAFSTTMSIIASIIVLVIYLAASIYFLQTLSDKSEPTISSTTQYPTDIDFVTGFGPNDDLFLFFQFSEDFADIHSYFKFDVTLQADGLVKKTYDIVKCSEINSTDYSGYDNKYCISGGTAEFDKNTVLMIDFYKCVNNTGSTICKTDDEINQLINTNTVYAWFFTKTANPFDYLSPIFYTYTYNSIILSNNHNTYIENEFKINELNTDNGLVFSNIENEKFMFLDKQKIYNSNTVKTKSMLLSINFNWRENNEIILRKYPKLQDVLAQIGGFFPILKFLGSLIVGLYNPIMMKLSFVNKLFSFEDTNNRIANKSKKNRKLIIESNPTRELNTINPNEVVIHEIVRKSDAVDPNPVLRNNSTENAKKVYEDYLAKKMIFKKKHQLEISFKEVFFSSFCSRICKSTAYESKKQCLDRVSRFVADKTDILSIVKDSRDKDLIKKIIFDEDQILLMKHSSKPKYEELEFLKGKMKEKSFGQLFEFYKEKRDAEKSEIDQKLFQMLDKDLVKYFDENMPKANMS